MTVSFPIADKPPSDEPTLIPLESRKPLTFESVPLDEARWNAWRAKGRLADAAFADTMRTLALMGVVAAAAVGVYWIGFD